MSVQITTAFVNQFKANVMHLLQIRGGKLRATVRNETLTGQAGFFDQIGSTEMVAKTSRHMPTPRMDTPHARRRVTGADFIWADLLDKQDKVRMLADMSSPYAEAARKSIARQIDRIIMTAFDATAYTGETGATSTAYDNNMTVGVQTVWPGVSAADTGMNLAKLIECRARLGSYNVDPEEEVFVAINARQISSLLKDERVISGDYNAALPLVEGKVSKVAGCTLIPTELVGTDANSDHKCFYWTKDGMLLAMQLEPSIEIDKRPDLSNSTQIMATLTGGATRMEENRVGYIICDPGGSPTTDA